jgi:hypothetical protein
MDTNLDYPQRDGSTKRKHLESIAKQSGKVPEELNVPQVDDSLLFIKYVFDSLSMTRQYSDNHPQMISESETYYWCKLHDIKLSPWHLNVLKKLDIAQINSLVTCQREQRGNG